MAFSRVSDPDSRFPNVSVSSARRCQAKSLDCDAAMSLSAVGLYAATQARSGDWAETAIGMKISASNKRRIWRPVCIAPRVFRELQRDAMPARVQIIHGLHGQHEGEVQFRAVRRIF